MTTEVRLRDGTVVSFKKPLSSSLRCVMIPGGSGEAAIRPEELYPVTAVEDTETETLVGVRPGSHLMGVIGSGSVNLKLGGGHVLITLGEGQGVRINTDGDDEGYVRVYRPRVRKI